MAGEHPSISGRARSPSENWLAAGVRAERFTRASRPTPPAHVPSNGKPALSTPLITGRTSPDIRAWPPSLRPPIPPSIGAAPPRRPPGPSHLGGVRWRPAATTTGATMLATIRRHALRVERRRPSSSAMGRADEPGARSGGRHCADSRPRAHILPPRWRQQAIAPSDPCGRPRASQCRYNEAPLPPTQSVSAPRPPATPWQ